MCGTQIIPTQDPTLECSPHPNKPSSWGGFLNDGSSLEGALGPVLGKDVMKLAAMLAEAEGVSAETWVGRCSVSRQANVRMIPCVKFDVVNGEATRPQFFMVWPPSVRGVRCGTPPILEMHAQRWRQACSVRQAC